MLLVKIPNFAPVSNSVWRGGQPKTKGQYKYLRDELKISTIINLRRENYYRLRKEKQICKELGLKLIHIPMYGICGMEWIKIYNVMIEMRNIDNDNIFIHCKKGRDRTGLMVAIYMVLEKGMDPEEAWQKCLVDFGHGQGACGCCYGKFRKSFDDYLASIV